VRSKNRRLRVKGKSTKHQAPSTKHQRSRTGRDCTAGQRREVSTEKKKSPPPRKTLNRGPPEKGDRGNCDVWVESDKAVEPPPPIADDNTKKRKKNQQKCWKIAITFLGGFCRTKKTESKTKPRGRNEKEGKEFGARDKKRQRDGGEKSCMYLSENSWDCFTVITP
jgi:hypothetical protein